MDVVKNGAQLITEPIPSDTDVEVENYKSATNKDVRDIIEAQILDELANGHYLRVSDKPQIVSALGAIPKNKDNTKFRLIHDASRPHGQAMNDLASHDPFRYQSLQDAIELIQPGDWLGKLDIKGALR